LQAIDINKKKQIYRRSADPAKAVFGYVNVTGFPASVPKNCLKTDVWSGGNAYPNALPKVNGVTPVRDG
jgi:hypothetical protein